MLHYLRNGTEKSVLKGLEAEFEPTVNDVEGDGRLDIENLLPLHARSPETPEHHEHQEPLEHTCQQLY